MAHDPAASDWRDLARRVQDEKDPYKMVELAQQLVAKLDEELREARPAHTAMSAE